MMKTKQQTYLFVALTFFFLLHSMSFARELPGNLLPAPKLGSAFISNQYKIAPIKCVEGGTVKVGQSVGDLKYTNEADFEKITSAFGGSISASGGTPFVKGGASVSYAQENAATDKRMNWFFEFHATPKSISFDDGDLRLSQAGQNVLQKAAGRVAQYCGDEFVYQIDYGAKLLATMSIEFASREDRSTFEAAAHVDVNFMVGSASASGSLNTMAQRMGSRTRVKVEAHQTGGHPGELSAILKSGVVDCNLNNMSQCMDTFAQVILYANGNFREQLKDENSYSVVRYHTAPYENTEIFELVPDGGFPMLSAQVERRREQIQEQYELESIAYDRAKYIKNRLRHFAPEQQMIRVESIYRHAFANMSILTKAMELCLAQPDKRCLDYNYTLENYNEADLEVTVSDQVDPKSNLGKLFQAVKDNDEKGAYRVITQGGPTLINQIDSKGYSPFHRAIKAGQTGMLNLLVTHDPLKGTDKSAVHVACNTAKGYTPLCLAAKGGSFEHIQCIGTLCAAGAKIDDKTLSGQTPLQVAVISGKLATVKKLITVFGANKNIKDERGRGLLHLAAESGSLEMVEYLMSQGLSIHDKDATGLEPLDWAIKAGHKAVEDLLTEKFIFIGPLGSMIFVWESMLKKSSRIRPDRSNYFHWGLNLSNKKIELDSYGELGTFLKKKGNFRVFFLMTCAQELDLMSNLVDFIAGKNTNFNIIAINPEEQGLPDKLLDELVANRHKYANRTESILRGLSIRNNYQKAESLLKLQDFIFSKSTSFLNLGSFFNFNLFAEEEEGKK